MRPETVGGALSLAVFLLVGCIVFTADHAGSPASSGAAARAAISLPEALDRTQALNLTRQLARLAHDQPTWSATLIQDVNARYRVFLAECAIALPKGGDCVPSADVDELWHTHLLFSKQYERDCFRVFGYVLHHEPHDAPEPEQRVVEAAEDAAGASSAVCSAQRLKDPFPRVERTGGKTQAGPNALTGSVKGACDGTCNGNCGAAPSTTNEPGGKCEAGKCQAGKCKGDPACSGMSMGCGGTFSFGIEQTVLWSFWDIQSDGQFVISVFVIVLIGLLREWLVVYRQHRLLRKRKSRRALPVTDRDPMLNGPNVASSQSMDFGDSVLYMLSVALAYILMLIIMGFKYGTTFAVLGGLMLGHWVFTVKRLGFPKTLRLRVDEGDGCCEEPVEGN